MKDRFPVPRGPNWHRKLADSAAVQQAFQNFVGDNEVKEDDLFWQARTLPGWERLDFHPARELFQALVVRGILVDDGQKHPSYRQADPGAAERYNEAESKKLLDRLRQVAGGYSDEIVGRAIRQLAEERGLNL